MATASADYLKVLLDPSVRPLSREEFEQLKKRHNNDTSPLTRKEVEKLKKTQLERRRSPPAPRHRRSPPAPRDRRCPPAPRDRRSPPISRDRDRDRAADERRHHAESPARHRRDPATDGREAIPDGPVPPPPGPPRQSRGPYEVRSAVGQDCGVIRTLGLCYTAWANPVAERLVRVCVSSIAEGQLASTVDVKPEIFATDDQPWSWVIFDFLENSVRAAQYSLVHPSPRRTGYLRSWQLEGSQDSTVWDTLARHNNDQSLDHHRQHCIWDLRPEKFYRYFRVLLDPGGNSDGSSALSFTSFELFGDMSSPVSERGIEPAPGDREQGGEADDRVRGREQAVDRMRGGEGARRGHKRGPEWEYEGERGRQGDVEDRKRRPGPEGERRAHADRAPRAERESGGAWHNGPEGERRAHADRAPRAERESGGAWHNGPEGERRAHADRAPRAERESGSAWHNGHRWERAGQARSQDNARGPREERKRKYEGGAYNGAGHARRQKY